VSAVLATLPRTLPAVVQALKATLDQSKAFEQRVGLTDADLAEWDRLDARAHSLWTEARDLLTISTGVSVDDLAVLL